MSVEPAALDERGAARFISISPRLLRQLVSRGDIRPIRVPGIRRLLYDVQDLRALLGRWKTASEGFRESRKATQGLVER